MKPRTTISSAGIEIAHLKMTLTPSDGDSDLVVLNQVRNEHVAELSHTLDGELSRGELIVNLRAEGDPARLAAAVDAATLDAADAQSLVVNPVHSEHFRPGQPHPAAGTLGSAQDDASRAPAKGGARP